MNDELKILKYICKSVESVYYHRIVEILESGSLSRQSLNRQSLHRHHFTDRLFHRQVPFTSPSPSPTLKKCIEETKRTDNVMNYVIDIVRERMNGDI